MASLVLASPFPYIILKKRGKKSSPPKTMPRWMFEFTFPLPSPTKGHQPKTSAHNSVSSETKLAASALFRTVEPSPWTYMCNLDLKATNPSIPDSNLWKTTFWSCLALQSAFLQEPYCRHQIQLRAAATVEWQLQFVNYQQFGDPGLEKGRAVGRRRQGPEFIPHHASTRASPVWNTLGIVSAATANDILERSRRARWAIVIDTKKHGESGLWSDVRFFRPLVF